jgi:hypothetical protein
MVLQIVDEGQRLDARVLQEPERQPQRAGVPGQQRVQALGPREEVVGQVRTVRREPFQLLQRHVQLVEAPAAELAGQERELVSPIYRQRMLVVLAQRLARLRLDAEEWHGIEAEHAGAPDMDLMNDVAGDGPRPGVRGV